MTPILHDDKAKGDPPISRNSINSRVHVQSTTKKNHSMDLRSGELSREVQALLSQDLDLDSLLAMSEKLQLEMRQHLVTSPQCMLPSFNYNLPAGQEKGTYLALEVGGSNLRMSLVQLQGRGSTQPIQIRRTMSLPIDTSVRQLKEYAFFDWMAANVRQLLLMEGEPVDEDVSATAVRMGVAWSFPIESVSASNRHGMGRLTTRTGKHL